MSAKSTSGSSNRAASRKQIDQENPPLTAKECAEMRRVPLAALIREKLGISRERFAAAYGIPLAKLTSWERHEAEPTETESAYLRAIQREPEVIRKALAERVPV